MKPIHAAYGAVLCVLAAGLVSACGGSSSNNNNNGGGNPPVVVGLSPSSGLIQGGTVVQIGGGNFSAPLTVTFDGVAATNVTVIDSTSLTATAPLHAAGAVDVAVTNGNGTGTLAGAFTYVTFPPVLPATDQQIDTDAATPINATHPAICCANTGVFVAWAEPRGAMVLNRDVWFQGSFDRGATWRATDVRVNTNAAGASDADNVVICCSGLLVHVAWLDNRNGTYEPFFNRSVDGGNTWLVNDIRLNVPLAGTTNTWIGTLDMCCEGNTVVVAWADDRNAAMPAAAWDVFAAPSIDGGSSFAPDRRINTNAAGVLPFVPSPRLCCDGTNVYICWADQRNGAGDNDIRFSRSTDNGVNWLPADVRVDQDVGVNSAIQPSICCSGGYVYVAWRDDRIAPYDIYVRGSPNSGLNFNVSEVRVNTGAAGAALAGRPDMCCDAQRLYVTWQDNRNIGIDVWFNASADGALTFQGTDTRLDLGTFVGSQPNGDPQICCNASGQLTVIWDDFRNGMQNDIFANYSADSGVNWQGTDQRLDTDTPAVGNSVLSPLKADQLCCDGSFFYAVWQDTRNAMGPGADIFFNGNVP